MPLGFFINSNAAAGGVADAPATKRGLSNKPGPLSPGSGSGSHVIQRSDIPGQKAQDAHASEQTVQASPAVVKSEPSPPAPPPALAGPPGPTATEDSTKVRKDIYMKLGTVDQGLFLSLSLCSQLHCSSSLHQLQHQQHQFQNCKATTFKHHNIKVLSKRVSTRNEISD